MKGAHACVLVCGVYECLFSCVCWLYVTRRVCPRGLEVLRLYYFPGEFETVRGSISDKFALDDRCVPAFIVHDVVFARARVCVCVCVCVCCVWVCLCVRERF